jgi:integrase
MAWKKTFHPSEEFGRTVIFSRTGKKGETFYIRYWFKGCRYSEKAPGPNLRSAEQLLSRRRSEMKENPNSFVPKTEQRRQKRKEQRAEDSPPFRKFFEGRFTTDYAASLRSKYYLFVGRDLCDWFRDKRLREITTGDVYRFRHAAPKDFPAPKPDHKGRDPRTRRTPSTATIRRRLALLQLVFEKAIKWGLLHGPNPVAGVDRPKAPKNKKTNFLRREEYDAILKASPPWLQPILSLAVNTGLRRKELVNLRWEDVDFQTAQLYVSEDNKTATGRHVPMNATAVSLLKKQRERIRELQRETDPTRIIPWVFVDGAGEDYTGEKSRATISRAYEIVARRIGLDRPTTFHDLRHHAEFRIMPSAWRKALEWRPIAA